MFRSFYIIFLLLGAALFGSEKETLLSYAHGEVTESVRNTAMPELSENRVGKILTRYFEEGLGGAEHWKKIESLNVVGRLKTASGEVLLAAYQKKPNLIKMALTQETSQNTLTLAYDGEFAWKQPGTRAKPELMTEAEARRFIHSARFGNYLLYPFATGKRISLVDTVPVEGAICHQIRVELDTGYQVDYFIDIREYLEIKVENTDTRTGFKNTVTYKDYIRKYGMPIAKKVESFDNGEWVSSLVLEEVKVNSGVMPWMFHMPE